MRPINLVDIYTIQSIIERRVKDKGMSVEFKKGLPTAATSANKILLPALIPPVTPEQVDLTYGYVIHECGHHSRPEAFEILKNAKLEPGSPLHSLFNILEDEAMEREVSSHYVGDRKALGTSMSLHIRNQLDKWGKQIRDHENWDEDTTKSTAAYLLALDARGDWDARSSLDCLKYRSEVSPVAIALSGTLSNKGYVSKIREPKDPKQVWELTIELYKELYPNADHDELEKIKQQGLGGENIQGDGGEEENDKHDAGVSDTHNNAGSGGSTDNAKGEGQSKSKSMLIPWDQFIHSEHGNDYGTTGPDWTGHKSKEKLGVAPESACLVVKCKEEYPGYGACVQGSTALASQLRRYIQAQTRAKISPDKMHGRLNSQSLVKLFLPPIDKGEWNKKIFYTHGVKEKIDTCIGVLVDWSGSMSSYNKAESKKAYAADATGRLYQVFGKILNIPILIAAFSNSQTCRDIGIVKDWADRSSTLEQIGGRFKWFDQYTSANNDSDSLLWMYNQIRKRPEPRKIMMVLSDGAPAGYYSGDSDANLLHVTKAIQDEGVVDLVGLGICDNRVERYYKHNTVINRPEEINAALLGIMREVYFNG